MISVLKEDRFKGLAVHLLGAVIIISTYHHSDSLYSLLVSIPVFLVSLSIYSNQRFRLPALCAATLYSPLLTTTGSMDESLSFLLYSTTFVLPFVIYWILVLAFEFSAKVERKGAVIASSYIFFTLALFYLVPSFLGISEYFFSAGNREGQALLLVGFGLMAVIPYQVLLEFNSDRS